MASPIRFDEFKRRFKRHGVETGRTTRHWVLKKEIEGVVRQYTFAVKRNNVSYHYEKAARKLFNLTPADGVSDEEFKKG